MSKIAAPSQNVTIEATAGSATFDEINGIVTYVFVTPVGTPSAANAKLDKVVGSKAYPIVTSEAVSTTATHALYDKNDDGGVLTVTAATPLKVTFDTATNSDVWQVTVEYLP